MPPLDDLLDTIFDGKKPPFYAEFKGWVQKSRRFKAFATTHNTKIRSKLKNVRDENGMKDLRAELETAMILLHEERFTLEYERYTASKQRGPDFTVIFKTHTPFNVEVRRIRSIELDTDEALTSKLMAVLCDKVKQMPTSIINLLWLIPENTVSEADITLAMVTLRQMAERKTEEFFIQRGFKNSADFLKHYSQLSGIILHQPKEHVIWLNSLAKHKAPQEIILAIQRL
jgi:hypothetical protein